MKSFNNRADMHADILEQMVQAQDGDYPPPILPDDLKHQLAQLSLLYGVPVEYMIPDIRLLPTEAIRFFYIDRNWLDRLIDGAISVGVLSTQDAVFNLLFFKEIYKQIDIEQLQLRSTLREVEQTQPEEIGGQITGFIFRSQVVADFPGIEINPTLEGKTLPIIRMDTLSPNTLLCLIYGVPDKVEFIQPGEGLQFGLFPNDPPEQGSDFHVFLRGLGEGGYPAGEQIENEHGVKLLGHGSYRSGAGQADRVLNVSDLITNIQTSLPAGALKDDVLSAGGFAIQMTKTAQKQVYDSDGKFPPCNPADEQSGEQP